MRMFSLFVGSMICASLAFPLGAQTIQKRPLTHADADAWNRISGETISPDGRWVAYGLGPLEGDSRTILLDRQSGKADTILRATAPRLSLDSRFAFVTIKPPADVTKKEKIAKKKSEEMSKDSVGIIELGKPGMTVIPRTKSYQLPEKGAGWVAIHLEKDPPARDSTRTKKRDAAEDEEGTEAAKKEEKGTVLIARELASGTEIRFPLVAEFLFSKDGSSLLLATTDGDSTVAPSVLRLDTRSRVVDTLIRGKGKFKQLAVNEAGAEAAFLADRDTSKAKQRYFTLMHWRAGRPGAIPLVDTASGGLPARWTVSEHARPEFSRDGSRLYLGTAPVLPPDDTTFNDVETARLDVWNWQDGYLQSHQLKDLETEKKRSYRAVVHLAGGNLVQLADSLVPDLTTGDEGNAPYAIGASDLPYRKILSWEDQAPVDVYLVEIRTGSRRLVLPRHRGRVSLSPGGAWLTWYDLRERHWYAMNTATLAKAKVTAGVAVPLFDELNDVPDDPPSYGSSGWIGKDSLLLVNDRYDIWATDPSGRRPAFCITGGTGRKDRLQFRSVNLDPEARFFPPDSNILLSAFHLGTKEGGFYRLRPGGGTPERLLLTSHRYVGTTKARLSGALILRRSDVASQELFASATDFAGMAPLSDSNPQQREILWPSVELLSWKASTGRVVEGLLYKPENFDPKRRYPMLVYYYERNADLLHSYTIPAHSASTINRSYCASNGYLVFIPDIHYRTGYPGKSAMECIVPGVRALIRKGFVDSTRIGLQGQSWGGYQTAYLVTQTPMFRCAFAGAPVANMTSAYGGIRWESGRVREMQYEKAQSRIGGTLWEKLDLYLENSPLFHLPKVTTPLLIMSNDNDGAVPWYQGIELFTALRRLNKPAWMLVYNNEAHNLVQTKNRKDLSLRMMQFFDHYLKDAPLPVWMGEGVPAIMKTKTLGTGLLPAGAR